MRRWIVIPALASLFLALPGKGESKSGDASDAFLRGNTLYQSGDYAGAMGAYQEVLNRGWTAPELEYNLANAALKAGKVGEAILHYRRALRLRPNYENAFVNLNYARSLTQDLKADATPAATQGRLSKLRLGPARAALLLWLSVFLLAALGAWRRSGKRVPGWWSGAQWTTAALALLLTAALVFEWSQLQKRKEGVILAEETEVRVGPSPQQTVSFRLHQGTEVDILRRVPGWIDVKVSSELEGWVPETTVQPI
jgi:tetratricopeptide (TPR) repeat protein